ncbi:cancer-related nucleoside-triphosphatase isoform X2 [Lagenorhynchus albirostris]|uniref:cancer-related nucleoside-triphosphatase isoform X2 n=1 Tax=Lagenorhynchus albirostris TaxID=27610 RepID=UPI0028ED3D2F|nr:cancer-related nucleoside-triphosphatase isoform X2 [Lagenorhynchus albirostris]
MARHVFLTGPPGVGKTTLIQKVSEVLKSSGVPVDGFYTEEVRQGGRRIGFDVVTLSGARGPLSRIGSELPPGKRECCVGQYVVDLTSFEQLVLPVLRNVSHQGKQKPPSARDCDVCAEWPEVKTTCHCFSAREHISWRGASVPCLSRFLAFGFMKSWRLFQRKPDSCFP